MATLKTQGDLRENEKHAKELKEKDTSEKSNPAKGSIAADMIAKVKLLAYFCTCTVSFRISTCCNQVGETAKTFESKVLNNKAFVKEQRGESATFETVVKVVDETEEMVLVGGVLLLQCFPSHARVGKRVRPT